MSSAFHHKTKFAIEIIAALMILLFVYAGVSKLIAQPIFFQQINMDPFIGAYAKWLSWIVPIAELAIAVLLLFKNTQLAGFYAFTFLMILFTLFITALLVRDKPLPCSCGGIIQALSWQQHLVLNGCFIALGITGIGILLHRRNRKT